MIENAGLLHAEAMAIVHASAFPPGGRWGPAAFTAQLAQPGVFGLIDPEGAILLARVVAGEAEILTLAVVPGLRRRGRGRALLEAALARARADGARRVFLEVSAANEAAAALYGAAGFREVGLRRRYYADGTDALLLAVELAPLAV